MDIKNKFLELTKLTYIYGTEHLLENHLPSGFERDQFGNYFYKIGDSQTMFTCHLDTATDKVQKVKHVIKGNIISTDGSTILGADDKAGMTVLLYMIEKNVPGLYYFFVGEEVGCIGSNAASAMDFSSYKRCISFDRRGYSSIITHQLGGRCCSDIFANSICKELKPYNLFYEPDPTGVVTDSAMFTNQIPKIKEDFRSWGPADEEFIEEEIEESAKIKVTINDVEYLATIKSSKVKEEKYFITNWINRSSSYTGFKEVEWDGKSCYLLYDNSYKEYIGEREELIHVIDNLCDISIHDLNIIKKFK